MNTLTRIVPMQHHASSSVLAFLVVDHEKYDSLFSPPLLLIIISNERYLKQLKITERIFVNSKKKTFYFMIQNNITVIYTHILNIAFFVRH